MSNIDLTLLITAEEQSAGLLAAAKVRATDEMMAALEHAADAITGPVRDAEKASWPVKAAAASAVIAGTATADQQAALAAECDITGEALSDLAAKIAASASAYAGAAARISGLRRRTSGAIANANTQQEVTAVMEELHMALLAMPGGT